MIVLSAAPLIYMSDASLNSSVIAALDANVPTGYLAKVRDGRSTPCRLFPGVLAINKLIAFDESLFTIVMSLSTQKKTKDPIQRKNPILFNNTI